VKGDKAIRIGEVLPAEYKKINQAKCSCGATFWIIQPMCDLNSTRAEERGETLKTILAGEHLYDNVIEHLKSYDLE
jgi:hypothetical protein